MTTRTLVLLRHAKAVNPDGRPDAERPLTVSGTADAAAAGGWLAAAGLRPDVVLCSPAVRTRQTWHGVAVALAEADPDGTAPEVRYEPGLYAGGRTEVIDLLRTLGDDVGTVLVVGHNPTMTNVSVLLRPYGAAPETEELKTCGIAVHRGEAPWSAAEPHGIPLTDRHTARA